MEDAIANGGVLNRRDGKEPREKTWTETIYQVPQSGMAIDHCERRVIGHLGEALRKLGTPLRRLLFIG